MLDQTQFEVVYLVYLLNIVHGTKDILDLNHLVSHELALPSYSAHILEWLRRTSFTLSWFSRTLLQEGNWSATWLLQPSKVNLFHISPLPSYRVIWTSSLPHCHDLTSILSDSFGWKIVFLLSQSHRSYLSWSFQENSLNK